MAAALGASDEQFASSWAVMKAHGNLSGASNFAVLDHLNRRTHGQPLQRRWVLCLSMGLLTTHYLLLTTYYLLLTTYCLLLSTYY